MTLMERLSGLASVFPHPVSMEDIRRLRRRRLSSAEKARPYARYYYKELAEIPAEDLEAVNAGPVDPARALPVQERDELMKPGYLEVETGYAVLPDGSGFAATLVRMPGVTPEMLDWWFNWHPLEGLRYAIWCPVAHKGIGVEDPSRHLDSSGIPLRERNYGSTHYPVERVHMNPPVRLRIRFLSPRDFGLDESLFHEPGISRAYCANVSLSPVRAVDIPVTVFFHAVRRVEGGVEYRSRYWSGYAVRDGEPVRVKLPPFIDVRELARGTCLHSLMEYNNLASFLPQLYEEMGGRIE